MSDGQGWFKEPYRKSLASKGISSSDSPENNFSSESFNNSESEEAPENEEVEDVPKDEEVASSNEETPFDDVAPMMKTVRGKLSAKGKIRNASKKAQSEIEFQENYNLIFNNPKGTDSGKVSALYENAFQNQFVTGKENARKRAKIKADMLDWLQNWAQGKQPNEEQMRILKRMHVTDGEYNPLLNDVDRAETINAVYKRANRKVEPDVKQPAYFFNQEVSEGSVNDPVGAIQNMISNRELIRMELASPNQLINNAHTIREMIQYVNAVKYDADRLEAANNALRRQFMIEDRFLKNAYTVDRRTQLEQLNQLRNSNSDVAKRAYYNLEKMKINSKYGMSISELRGKIQQHRAVLNYYSAVTRDQYTLYNKLRDKLNTALRPRGRYG
jgi:hypothetical protein